MSFAKILILAVFVLILVSLGTGAYSLFKGDDRDGTATVKALTMRVILSIALLIVIMILNALGLVTPHG